MDSIQGEASPSEMDCCMGPLPKGVIVLVLYIKSNPRRSALRRPKSDPQSQGKRPVCPPGFPPAAVASPRCDT